MVKNGSLGAREDITLKPAGKSSQMVNSQWLPARDIAEINTDCLEQMRLGLLKKPAPEEDDYEYIPFRRRPGIFAILQPWDHVVDQI